jgi:uroporphyrinogen-III synthase
LIKKIQRRKFLLPASDQLNADAPITLNNLKVDWTQVFKTVMSDLSDLADVYYDILAFFSPTGIKIFVQELPEQNDTRIAVLEVLHKESTIGLRVDILAPTPQHTFNDNGS